MPLRVLIVDDHRVFADALETLLTVQTDVHSRAASTVEEALDAAREGCPDVVLMDVALPGIDGIEGTKRVLEICPEAQVVALTGLDPDDVLVQAIDAGVSGLVSKSEPLDRLVDVIQRAAAGEMVLPASDAQAVLRRLQSARRAKRETTDRISRLTPREVEVLQALADGKSTDEIARDMFISPHTVHGHVGSILNKMGVRSKLEAVLFALRNDVIRL